MRIAYLVALAVIASGCSQERQTTETFSLYRNSPIDRSLRVHWATFDVDDNDSAYNRNNCEMAARLLNANVAESARAEGVRPHEGVGFWCEGGDYSENGTVPSMFVAAFPSDVPEEKQVP